MNKYEIMFIIDNSVSDEAKDAVVAKVTQIVENGGGKVEKVDKQGAKKLAYPIKDKTDGFYVLMNFECQPELIAELERQIRISDQVLRHMVVKLRDVVAKPAAELAADEAK